MLENFHLQRDAALKNNRTETHQTEHNSLQKIPKILKTSLWMLNLISNNFPKGCLVRFLIDSSTKIEK
jgi:hypothetical protein